MNFEYVDNIYRSRVTLLNILEERGYDVSEQRKFSPAEISVAIEAFPSLGFIVKKKDNADDECIVNYSLMKRQSLDGVVSAIERKDKGEIEVIFMIRDTVVQGHHTLALRAWTRNKIRISFFSVPNIVFDPRTHILVPKHEIVPHEEHKKILEEWNMTSKSQMPIIRFHIDPIIRILGAVPGDIIKITRPSHTAGTYIFYRIVTA